MAARRKLALTLPERPSEGLRIKNYLAAQLLAGEYPRLYRARVDDRPHAAGPRLDVAVVTRMAETRFRGGVSVGGGRFLPQLDARIADLGVEWFDTPAGAFAGLLRDLVGNLKAARRAVDLAETRLRLAEEGYDRLADPLPPGGAREPITCPECGTRYDRRAAGQCPTCALRKD